MKHTYPKPALTVDIVPIRYRGGHLEVLLIKRKNDPFSGAWALPGGYVDEGETPEFAARRELVEETHVNEPPLYHVGIFGAPNRDPRGWVVSAAYLAFTQADCEAKAGDDAAQVFWYPLTDLPDLAFDHGEIISAAHESMKIMAQTNTEVLHLLPKSFRTRTARHLYQSILGHALDARAFKAWLRRRNAVKRVGPGRFERAPTLGENWWSK